MRTDVNITRTDVKQKLRQYIVNTVLSGDGRGLDDHVDLTGSGLLDSFAVLQLVMYIEQELGVRLEPTQINATTFKNIDSIGDLVSQALAGSRP